MAKAPAAAPTPRPTAASGESATPPAGLRERQRLDRQARIIAAARDLFAGTDPDRVTIEAIAERAGVSGVTVHNYYGTKSGLLLALVAESDRELLAVFDRDLVGQAHDLEELVLRFFAIICDNATRLLDKAIWRQVIAASVSDPERHFGSRYRQLDHRLANVLVREIGRLQESGRVASGSDPQHLAWALFNLQNARFIDYIAADDRSYATVERDLGHDLRALMALGGASQGPR